MREVKVGWGDGIWGRVFLFVCCFVCLFCLLLVGWLVCVGVFYLFVWLVGWLVGFFFFFFFFERWLGQNFSMLFYADRLASTADITSGLQLVRAEVLRGLTNFLNMDRPEHHSTDRLKERGVADIPPSVVGNDLFSTRQTLALFRGQPLGDC